MTSGRDSKWWSHRTVMVLVLVTCRNREVNLALSSHVQKCKSAQTVGFYVSRNFRCKLSYCCGLSSVSSSWAGPELSDSYFLVKVDHGGVGRMEWADVSCEGFQNINIQCVVILLVCSYIFALDRKERAFISLFPFFACNIRAECSLTTIPSCLA